MKKFLLAVGLLSIAGTALAAGKSCEDLKGELAAKINAKGVQHYSLEAVDKGARPMAKWLAPAKAAPRKSSTSAVNPVFRHKKPTHLASVFLYALRGLSLPASATCASIS